jgi:nucleotide-binding universal stress UspA family protein
VINPLRSEEDAFRFTVIFAVLVAPVALAALIVSSTAALVVGGGVVVGLIVGLFWLKRDEPQEKMSLRRRGAVEDDRLRILVVANETLSGAALRAEITHRSRGRDSEVRVVCPALNTKIKHWVSDEDEARQQAAERLGAVLSRLERDGIPAQGDIGDGDPVQAMEDALRLFPANEVIISTHPYGRSNWLERNVIERARERFPVPITHVVVDLEHERESIPRREG